MPDGLDGRPITKSEDARDFFWRWGKSYAVRSGDWKLLHNGGMFRVPTSGIVNRTEFLKGTRLFNVREDPSESRDLAKGNPEIVQRLQKLHTFWTEKVAGSHVEAR